MMNMKVHGQHCIPLYRVLHKPLSFDEVYQAMLCTLSRDEIVIEIVTDSLITAVGIYKPKVKRAMTHLFTRCDYLEPPGHFIAIEVHELERMFTLFPQRLTRVWGRFETPYLN